ERAAILSACSLPGNPCAGVAGRATTAAAHEHPWPRPDPPARAGTPWSTPPPTPGPEATPPARHPPTRHAPHRDHPGGHTPDVGHPPAASRRSLKLRPLSVLGRPGNVGPQPSPSGPELRKGHTRQLARLRQLD